MADACGVELNIPAQQIGASYGDAFLAGRGIGLFQSLADIRQWVTIREVVQPEEKDRPAYDVHYAIFRELYLATRSLMHRLSEHVTGEG